MAALQEELAQTQRMSGAHEERTRISRDIHDTIAQGLSSMSLLATVALENGVAGQMPRTLAQINSLARDNLGDVRRIMAAWAPAELEDRALASALGRMLNRLEAESGLLTQMRFDDGLPVLATAVEVALLRTAQSALANVRQHAGASRVVVNLADAGDSVRLDIVDDGCGFDVPAWDTTFGSFIGTGSGGYGLHSMRARLRELGGGLDVESGPGDGAALSAQCLLSTVPKGRKLTVAITVLLVDDHPVVRTGLRTLIELNDHVLVVGEATSGEEAIALAEHLKPDVVLCDLRLGAGIDGVHGMRHPRVRLTERQLEVLKLMETGASNREIARELFLTEATVKTHLVHLSTKLNVESRTKAVTLARETELL